MNRTPIPWVKNPDGTQGFTWNPITGCLHGCSYCYARKLAKGRLKHVMLANNFIAGALPTDPVYIPEKLRILELANAFYPRRWPTRWTEPLNRRKPSGIFVCSLGELFGPKLPPEWTEGVLNTIKKAPHHRFYLLTKQPQELQKWSPFPDNAWVGVSLTGTDPNENAYGLAQIEAKVKYISYEPLLGPCVGDVSSCARSMRNAGINWVIIGAQTKPSVQPELPWVEDLINAADNAGAEVFLKPSLGWPLYTADGSRPYYRQESGTWALRQEIPA